MILRFLKSEMHRIIFFPEKVKSVCIPYLKFSDPLPETRLFFHLALARHTVGANKTLD